MYWLSNKLTSICEYTCVVLAVTDVIVRLYECLPGTLGTSPSPAVLITLSLLSTALASFRELGRFFYGKSFMI